MAAVLNPTGISRLCAGDDCHIGLQLGLVQGCLFLLAGGGGGGILGGDPFGVAVLFQRIDGCAQADDAGLIEESGLQGTGRRQKVPQNGPG